MGQKNIYYGNFKGQNRQFRQWWTGGKNKNLSKLLSTVPNARLYQAEALKTKRELQLDVREEEQTEACKEKI